MCVQCTLYKYARKVLQKLQLDELVSKYFQHLKFHLLYKLIIVY